MGAILGWLGREDYDKSVKAVGHRVVHGGPDLVQPMAIDAEALAKLKRLIPLAPLHQPHNIAGIEAAMQAFPGTPQVACFDTAFHRSHPFVSDTFALPRSYYDEGVRRYGFHGLSYEYIVETLRGIAPQLAREDVVIAHLGNGASMCAVHDGRSIASTMGFTALDGLPMGTRCGQLDPGVVLYLMAEKKMTAKEISDLLYKESGLKGMSGISQDMRELEASDSPAARDAIAYFVERIRRELAGLAGDRRRHRSHRLYRRHRRAFLAGEGSGARAHGVDGNRDRRRGQSGQRPDHQRPIVADHRLRHPDRRGAQDRRTHGGDRADRREQCRKGLGLKSDAWSWCGLAAIWRKAMKTRFAAALALLAGAAIGAVAVQSLHAAATPPAFVVTEIDIANLAAYQKDYVPLAQASVKASGGRLVAAGQKIVALEGAPPGTRVAINQFDSLEAVRAWRNSAQYKEARKIGDKYGKFRAFAIEGLPQ